MTIDFEKIKDEILSMGKDVGDKVSDVSNIAKLKLDIRSKEDFVEKQYAQLGHMYYEAHRDDADSVPERGMITAIVESETELESMKQELINLQGTSYCPSCGEKQQKDFMFCPKCGAKLKAGAASEDEMFVDEEGTADDTAETETVAETGEEADAVKETEAGMEAGDAAEVEPAVETGNED